MRAERRRTTIENIEERQIELAEGKAKESTNEPTTSSLFLSLSLPFAGVIIKIIITLHIVRERNGAEARERRVARESRVIYEVRAREREKLYA